jgi:hypothetical protein
MFQSAHGSSSSSGSRVAALQIEAAMARGLLSALRGAAARGAEIQRSRHLREDLDGKVYVSLHTLCMTLMRVNGILLLLFVTSQPLQQVLL